MLENIKKAIHNFIFEEKPDKNERKYPHVAYIDRLLDVAKDAYPNDYKDPDVWDHWFQFFKPEQYADNIYQGNQWFCTIYQKGRYVGIETRTEAVLLTFKICERYAGEEEYAAAYHVFVKNHFGGDYYAAEKAWKDIGYIID